MQSYTVGITNVNDNAVLFGANGGDSNPAINTVAENSLAGTSVGITAAAADADRGTTISYSLVTNAAGTTLYTANQFAIDATTGVVTTGIEKLDHEAAASQTIYVKATSSDGSAPVVQSYTVGVLNQDEKAPVFISDAEGSAIENQAILYTASAVDDSDISAGFTTYALAEDDDGNLLQIDSLTGEVSLPSGNLDYETKNSYSFTVIATDAANNKALLTVSVAIQNLFEGKPLAPTYYFDQDKSLHLITQANCNLQYSYDGSDNIWIDGSYISGIGPNDVYIRSTSISGQSKSIYLNYRLLDEGQVPVAPTIESVSDGVIQLGALDPSMFWQYRVAIDSTSDQSWSSYQTGNSLQLTPDLFGILGDLTKIEFRQVDLQTDTISKSVFASVNAQSIGNVVDLQDSNGSLVQLANTNNILLGNDSDLTIYGGSGADLLTNFHGGDVFIGGEGVDTIQINAHQFIDDGYNFGTSIIRIARMSDDAWSAIASGYNDALLETDPLSHINQGPAFYIESNDGPGIFQGEKIQLVDAGLVLDQITVEEIAPGLAGLHLSNLDHHLIAGISDDNVLGGWGNDVILGNGGHDYLLGAGGDDILVGGAIDSVNPFDQFASSKNPLVTSQLFGGSGEDTLVVIDGEVQATGGEGNDIFAFYETHANQNIKLSIKDLEAGDRIDLSYLYSGEGFQDRLTTILGNTALNKVASDGSRTIDLSSLTEVSSDHVVLRIEQSQSNGAEQQLSSQFVMDRSLTWHDDLSPLVYVG